MKIFIDSDSEQKFCCSFFSLPKLHMSIGVPYDSPKITSGDR